MKILDFMSFSPEWFISLPGVLITGGVVLLLIALIILLTSNKKGDKEKNNKDEKVEAAPATADVPVAPAPQQAPVENLNVEAVATPNVAIPDNNVNTFEQQPVEQSTVQNQNVQEPIDFTVMSTPQVAQPVEQPVIQTTVTQPVPEPMAAPVVNEEVKPSVSIYGGVSPTDSVKPVEQAAPVIYGGADPLENTAPIPRVETHSLYNQPEAKVVEPVQDVITPATSAVVNNPSVTIPDLSASTFGPMSAPTAVQAPVEQPVVQPSVAQEMPQPVQTPIVKEDIETLDF